MKICFKCQVKKPLTDFYRHPMMADGRVGKCKECNKADVRENRNAKLEYYREYDRSRANLPKRVAARAEYSAKNRAIPKKKLSKNAVASAWAKRHREKRVAHIAAGNAMARGKIVKQPCEVCGAVKVHAHHDDYSKPLDVRWLCTTHHAQHHKAMRKLARESK